MIVASIKPQKIVSSSRAIVPASGLQEEVYLLP